MESYSVGTVTPHSRQETGLASKCSAADKTLGRIPSKLLNKVLYPPWVPSETTLLFTATAETTQRKQPEKSSGGVGAFFFTRMINLIQTKKLETYIADKTLSRILSKLLNKV